MQIGLQEWIMMTTKMNLQNMVMKNIITMPKTANTRKNSRNKNRSTKMRSTRLPQMQERMPIQTYMRKKIKWMNRNQMNRNKKLKQ